MKKILLWVLLPLFLCSCSLMTRTKDITVVIPEHNWERNSNSLLWYTLKWNYLGEIRELHINQGIRTVKITIPAEETVFIGAFPLGNFECIGSAICPFSTSQTVILNQQEGYLVSFLLNADPQVIANLNYEKLLSYIQTFNKDFRLINDVKLVTDILNGKLSESSFEFSQPVKVENIVLLNGFWIAESNYDSNLYISNTDYSSLILCPGVHRYYNSEAERFFIIVVDADGKSFSYLQIATL